MAAQSKLLRVALIQGNKITEDRTLRKRASVTVGQEASNTFVVPVSNLPSSFTLFEYKGDKVSLVFMEGMDGKIKLRETDQDGLTLDQIKSQNLATKRGTAWVLPLSEQSKGRVSVGEVSLLFQFVTPPPEAPKVDLPADIRGSIFATLDKLFFSILGVSLAIHFAGAACIAFQPKIEDPELSLDQLPDRFAKAMMPVEIKKPEPKKEEKGPEKKEEEKKEAKKEPEKKEAPSAAAQKEALQKKVASKGMLKILGSSGGNGAFADVLGSGTGANDIANALNGAAGVGVATAVGNDGPKGNGAGKAAGIGDLNTAGGGNVNIGAKGDVAVKGRMADSAPEVDSGDVDREALARYVKQRKQAITGCYETELKRNPSLKGKVVIRFTIATSGRTKDVEIEENTMGSEAVASCIITKVRGWSFPFHPEADVPVAYPFVFSPAS